MPTDFNRLASLVRSADSVLCSYVYIGSWATPAEAGCLKVDHIWSGLWKICIGLRRRCHHSGIKHLWNHCRCTALSGYETVTGANSYQVKSMGMHHGTWRGKYMLNKTLSEEIVKFHGIRNGETESFSWRVELVCECVHNSPQLLLHGCRLLLYLVIDRVTVPALQIYMEMTCSGR